MGYYFSARVGGSFEQALERVRRALAAEGFGVISEINMAQTLREKIGVDFRPYTILGACNPTLAHDALQVEDKVGTMLPCNVVVQAVADGVEVAAIDPVASMQAIGNPRLLEKAAIVGEKLKRVVEAVEATTGADQQS